MASTSHRYTYFALALRAVLIINLTDSRADQEDRSTNKKAKAGNPTQETPITQKQIEAALQMPCPSLDFPGKTPLSEVLQEMETHWSKTLGHYVRFFPDFAELDLEGISSLEDVALVSASFGRASHTCNDALKLLFKQTTDPELAFLPATGHVLITTRAKAESDECLTTVIYDVAELLPLNPARISDAADSQPSSDNTQPKADIANDKSAIGAKGKTAGVTTATPLKNLIQQHTSPSIRWFEIDGEGGAISVYGHYLVIRQTPLGHEQTAALLDMLRAAIEKGGRPTLDYSELPARPLPGAMQKQKAGPRGHGGGYFRVDDRSELR